MNRLALIAFAVGALVVFWPVQRADVSPLFQHRPERPPHPIHIYQPPGHR